LQNKPNFEQLSKFQSDPSVEEDATHRVAAAHLDGVDRSTPIEPVDAHSDRADIPANAESDGPRTSEKVLVRRLPSAHRANLSGLGLTSPDTNHRLDTESPPADPSLDQITQQLPASTRSLPHAESH
jgi:hypothetical protein